MEEMSAVSEEVLATTEQMSDIVLQSVKSVKEGTDVSDLQVAMVTELNEVVEILEKTSEEVIQVIIPLNCKRHL